jgi:hypothetical protein
LRVTWWALNTSSKRYRLAACQSAGWAQAASGRHDVTKRRDDPICKGLGGKRGCSGSRRLADPPGERLILKVAKHRAGQGGGIAERR